MVSLRMLILSYTIQQSYPMFIQNFKILGEVALEKSFNEIFYWRKKKWTNIGNDKPEDADSFSHDTSDRIKARGWEEKNEVCCMILFYFAPKPVFFFFFFFFDFHHSILLFNRLSDTKGKSILSVWLTSVIRTICNAREMSHINTKLKLAKGTYILQGII